MPISEQWKITLFLKKFFEHWQPDCYVVPRDINQTALIALGLTSKQREKMILNLKPRDYFSGPKPEEDPDKFGAAEIWEFSVISNGESIYVKLRLSKEKTKKVVAKCLSFHRAEKTINFPYKENH